MRYRQFVRDLSRTTLQLCLARLGLFLFPFPNVSLELFQMGRARIDRLQHLRCFSSVIECRQRRNVRFLPLERLESLPLPRSFMNRPVARRFARDRFDSTNSRCDRFLSHNTKWPDLRCRSYMRATAKLHGVAIQLPPLPANL